MTGTIIAWSRERARGTVRCDIGALEFDASIAWEADFALGDVVVLALAPGRGAPRVTSVQLAGCEPCPEWEPPAGVDVVLRLAGRALGAWRWIAGWREVRFD